MTPDKIAAVFAPKVAGGLNLTQAVIDSGADLDFFLSVSSLAQVLGWRGQSNYAGANAFLEGLARAQRAHGIPGTCVNIGMLGEAGFVARSEAMTGYLESAGWLPLANGEALARRAHGAGERKPQPHLCGGGLDAAARQRTWRWPPRRGWRRWRKAQAMRRTPPDNRWRSSTRRSARRARKQSSARRSPRCCGSSPKNRAAPAARRYRARFAIVIRIVEPDRGRARLVDPAAAFRRGRDAGSAGRIGVRSGGGKRPRRAFGLRQRRTPPNKRKAKPAMTSCCRAKSG